MQMWLADSLATLALVCKEKQSLSIMFRKTAFLIHMHRFNGLLQCTLWAKPRYHHSSG